MILTKSLIKADIIAAKQAIDYYESNGVKDIKNIAAYHLQQAVEKLIKYQIYESGNNLNNSQLYTHNIERLIVYGDSLGIGLIVPTYIRERSIVLTSWEAGSRYDVGFSMRINVLNKTYDIVEEWYRQVI